MISVYDYSKVQGEKVERQPPWHACHTSWRNVTCEWVSHGGFRAYAAGNSAAAAAHAATSWWFTTSTGTLFHTSLSALSA
jgi:hypothetical protein